MEALIPAPVDCEVRSVIEFLNTQSIAPMEINRQLCQVYDPNVMSKHMVHRWFRQFSVGRQTVHDEKRSGRPSVITDYLVELVRERITKRCYSRSENAIYAVLKSKVHYVFF
jgi:transposase